jgi:hypothetical protein
VGLVSEATARDVPGDDGRAERRAVRAQRADEIRERAASRVTSGEFRGLAAKVAELEAQTGHARSEAADRLGEYEARLSACERLLGIRAAGRRLLNLVWDSSRSAG